MGFINQVITGGAHIEGISNFFFRYMELRVKKTELPTSRRRTS